MERIKILANDSLVQPQSYGFHTGNAASGGGTVFFGEFRDQEARALLCQANTGRPFKVYFNGQLEAEICRWRFDLSTGVYFEGELSKPNRQGIH